MGGLQVQPIPILRGESELTFDKDIGTDDRGVRKPPRLFVFDRYQRLFAGGCRVTILDVRAPEFRTRVERYVFTFWGTRYKSTSKYM